MKAAAELIEAIIRTYSNIKGNKSIGSEMGPSIEETKEIFVPILNSFLSDKKVINKSLSGTELKVMRESHNLTLRQVEEKTGISNSYLSQLESGKIKRPSHDTILKLTEFYNTIDV